MLAFIVLCLFVPPMARMFWEALKFFVPVLIVVIAVALDVLWWLLLALLALGRTAWTARERRRKRAPVRALKAAPVAAVRVKPVAKKPVLADPGWRNVVPWWDLVPDDAFVPPFGWRVRKKLRLPARPLPVLDLPGAPLPRHPMPVAESLEPRIPAPLPPRRDARGRFAAGS